MNKAELPALVAPNGCQITGIIENVLTIYAIEHVHRDEAGKVQFEYNTGGESRTEWDSAQPIERDGQLVFEDEYGMEWLESQLIVEVDDDGE